MKGKVRIIVTVGPATHSEQDLRMIKDKGIDFVRVNMSHSSLDEFRYFLRLAKKADLPFIIDTEGSQIRTGCLKESRMLFEEGAVVRIYGREIAGDSEKISLSPPAVVKQLDEGDLIFVDFDTLVLKVSDTSTAGKGYVSASVVTSGLLGRNKAAVVVSGTEKSFELPVLTEKDKKAIEIGLKEGIGYIAVSFVRKPEDIDAVRKATRNAMKVISKVEAKESLKCLDGIIEKSDFILVDRGDLGKEVAVENIPIIQKSILKKAHEGGKPVFIATNLLESMVENKKPTRAEVNDIMNTILDGADGLILAAETAIGKNPMACINMLNKIIRNAEQLEHPGKIDPFSDFESSALIEPHGGRLVERIAKRAPENLGKLVKVRLNSEQLMDVEQIAVGTFSPLEGFMCEKDFKSVLDDMRLSSGVVWPIPIVLDVAEEKAGKISVGDDVALTDEKGGFAAVLHVEDKYRFDRKEMAGKLYGTNDESHPGVRIVMDMQPVLLGGKIDLLKRREAEFREYSLTPRQVRRLFEDRGWAKVVGFHTRNVIHRGHEFIQLEAMQKENCDGLFVHPVIGKKKPGDFNAKYIIKSYEKMMKDFYPKNSVVFSTFSTFSRYAGPREALFTALCRKNFGCSHFIVGRDHTGVGNFYHPNAAHQIFDRFPDLGIKPIKFDKVFYSNKLKRHVHEADVGKNKDLEELHISGTEARKMLEAGQVPPEWFMRPEISAIIREALNNKEEVFVKGEEAKGKRGKAK